MVARGVGLGTHEGDKTEIPAYMAENDRNLGDAPQRSVRAALAAGIPIAMGTDASVPFVRHGDNAMELVLMVEAGLSPMQSKWLQPAMRPILLLAFTRIGYSLINGGLHDICFSTFPLSFPLSM